MAATAELAAAARVRGALAHEHDRQQRCSKHSAAALCEYHIAFE